MSKHSNCGCHTESTHSGHCQSSCGCHEKNNSTKSSCGCNEKHNSIHSSCGCSEKQNSIESSCGCGCSGAAKSAYNNQWASPASAKSEIEQCCKEKQEKTATNNQWS